MLASTPTSAQDAAAEADPTNICVDAVGAAVVTLEAALVLEATCDEAVNAAGNSFFVLIDEPYYSQPLDSLVTVEVVELAAPAPAVTPTPIPTFTPRQAELNVATPDPTLRPVSPPTTTAPQAAPAASFITATSVVATAAPTGVIANVTAVDAADFGWSPSATSAAHVAAVDQSGVAVVHVTFTG